jgi:hypothetical protein
MEHTEHKIDWKNAKMLQVEKRVQPRKIWKSYIIKKKIA